MKKSKLIMMAFFGSCAVILSASLAKANAPEILTYLGHNESGGECYLKLERTVRADGVVESDILTRKDANGEGFFYEIFSKDSLVTPAYPVCDFRFVEKGSLQIYRTANVVNKFSYKTDELTLAVDASGEPKSFTVKKGDETYWGFKKACENLKGGDFQKYNCDGLVLRHE